MWLLFLVIPFALVSTDFDCDPMNNLSVLLVKCWPFQVGTGLLPSWHETKLLKKTNYKSMKKVKVWYLLTDTEKSPSPVLSLVVHWTQHQRDQVTNPLTFLLAGTEVLPNAYMHNLDYVPITDQETGDIVVIPTVCCLIKELTASKFKVDPFLLRNQIY